jgi:sterol desaturase/sphingolipid hydroxylase (fatty acid hydroxylase superfamily)
MWTILNDYLSNNWLIAISTPIYIVLISLEVILSNYRQKNFYSIKDSLMNLWLNIANASLGLVVKASVLVLMGWFLQFHFIEISNSYFYWIALFLGLDVCFYFEHRCEHYCRLLWAVHVTHHSSEEFNLTTGFRSSVFRPLVSFWFFIPLVIFGFKPIDILFMDAICQIYGIIVHTRFVKQMPAWFEAVFVSPSHHRVHHASNVVYLDKNMGMVLILWDRLFGTFQNEIDSDKVIYGLTKNPERPFHPIKIIAHEWQDLWKVISMKNISFSNRVKYLFNPPGWSHDGSTLTAKEMRKAIKN